MGTLNAGALSERIVLLTTGAPALSDGRGGYFTAAADTELPLWARVQPLSTAEKLRLGQTLNSEVYRVTIRALHPASAKQRLVWQGKTLNVVGVTPAENREYLTLLCVNGGQ